MGLPMYVSPSPSKRQLPSKQPTSPPYTPQAEESFEETYQNFRAGAYDVPDITEPSELEPQRAHRSRRSTSLPYNLVQQHIQRLHQLHHLHRTREQQMSSPNLASRRGLNSSHHLSLRAQMQAQAAQARRNPVNENIFDIRNIREDRLDDSHDEIIDFSSFDDLVSSFDNNNNNINNNNNNYSRNNLGVNLLDGVYQRNHNINNNNNDNDNNSSRSHHHSSNVALDSVIRRVNLLRQYSQQQESRIMRSSPRHHRSSTGHSSGRSSTSRTSSSQNLHVDRRRDDLIQRGIDVPPSTIRHSSSQLPEPTLLYPNEHNTPSLPPISRLSAWHTRRGVNWSPQSQQRQERRSSFADDFYSTTEVPHPYEDDHHMSRILSPTPTRRYDARFAATLASSLPIGNDHELFGTDNGSNVDRISSSNEPVRTEQRGSASGEVC